MDVRFDAAAPARSIHWLKKGNVHVNGRIPRGNNTLAKDVGTRQFTNDTIRLNEFHVPNIQEDSEVQSEDLLSENETVDDDFCLDHNANHFIKLLTPVSLCMFLVLTTVHLMSSNSISNVHLLYTPFQEKSTDAGLKFWSAFTNSMIVITIIVLLTIILIVLYKERCYKIIRCWFILSTFMMLFVLGYVYIEELFRASNIPLDYVTGLVILWNFGVVGMMAIHWFCAVRIQQGYLIYVAAQMALVFIKYLPEWTIWAVLILFCVWDLFAVLCPKGPLRILVETAQKRNEEIFPALVYSSTNVYAYMGAHSNSSNVESVSLQTMKKRRAPVQVAERNQIESNQIEMLEEHSVKLGLGDFIFYAILVGQSASSGDWVTTIACFIAIFIGLYLTLLLQMIWQKVLPALPLSITFGLALHLVTWFVIKPFMENFSVAQVFI